MKYFCSIVILLSIFSCNNKYEGNWTSDYFKEVADNPKNITISEDSITFNFWAFNHCHKYPLKIKRKELWFNDLVIKAKIKNDTLSLNNLNFYVKDVNDSISKSWFGRPILNINLPKNHSYLYQKKYSSQENSWMHYLFYGKRLDNNKFNLQLNDKYADFSEIPAFLAIGHRSRHLPLPVSLLFIDKSTKLSDVEKLFHNHQKVNSLKIELINNINLNYSDSLGLHYEYETLYKKLPPMFTNDNYSPSYSRVQTPPPSPFAPTFEDNNSNVSYFILKDNTILHNKKEVTTTEIKLLVENAINKNCVIISLYDLESNYETFLKMNAIIDGVYYKKRNDLALNMFNKSYEELEIEQASKIKQEIPLKHIWSYSISHFKDVTQKGNRFFGLKVKHIDSLLVN